ncbi:MAG: AraC family transcriptional regulator, partial [Pedobacter agri]
IYGLKRKKSYQSEGDSFVDSDYQEKINKESQITDFIEKPGLEAIDENILINGSFLDRTDKINKLKQIDLDLVHKIEDFITQKEVFRQSGLTLSELASLCDLPNHKLTELINGHYKMSFNNYINGLRIDYVKKRLDQNDWKLFTLEAIAFDAGFSTRNTFFVAFKKKTGITPSSYVSDLKRLK